MFTGKPQHKNSASKTYYKIGGLELGMVLFIGKKKLLVVGHQPAYQKPTNMQ